MPQLGSSDEMHLNLQDAPPERLFSSLTEGICFGFAGHLASFCQQFGSSNTWFLDLFVF